MSLHDWTCPPQSPLEKQIYLATFFFSALNTKQKCTLQNRIRAELCICDRLASHILHSTASHAILLLEEVIGGGSKRSKSKLPTSSFCPFHDRFLSDLAMMLKDQMSPHNKLRPHNSSLIYVILASICSEALIYHTWKSDNIHYVTITSLLAVFTFPKVSDCFYGKQICCFTMRWIYCHWHIGAAKNCQYKRL